MKGRPSYAYSERLMKKMGWTEGKGLGKNENGSPDFIRPKVKVNTKGIGFTGVDDRWIEHQEAFDSLLGNLNDGNPAAKEDKLISVEERAFKLGGRVHYSKFLRGKDLSQMKKEDLNAIVVKRKNKKDLESVRGADANGQDLSGVKTHTSSLSYQEYFAQRMKASKRRRGLEEDGDSQSCEQNIESGGEDSEMKFVKKSKRFEKNTSAQNEWTSCTDKDMVGTGLALNGVYTENAGSSQDENVQPKKKKKKLKDKFDDGSRSQSSEMSVEQREEMLMKDPVEVATMPDKFCRESVVPERRKKPKHADDSEPTLLEATVSHTEPCSEDGVSQQVKRKSRHKSCDSGESEEFENVASSAERALKEDVLRKQKKSKRAVENEEVFKQHGKLKKLKRDLADEDEQIEQEDHSQVRKRGTSKAAVLDANAEVLPKDCELGKLKQKQEAKEKKGVAKLNAKASAREGSSQLLEVASKKCEQEQEENDEYRKQIGGACVKAKSVLKQNLKEDASFGDRNPQQKQTNQNTKGNKQSKQGQEDIAAAEKGHSEEDVVPRRQKKSKCTAKIEAVFEQRGQSKKLKCDLADKNEQIKQEGLSQVRKRGTSEAVVLGANAEVLSKDCELGKPKQKQEATEKKGVAKLNAKANAREGSSQQQEVASKKCEQEQEKNDKYENQIGGARVKTKTVSKQKLKKDTSFGDKNLQQKQTNQNTEGNERPKQVLENIAAPEKRRPEKKVVQTSNIPQKKLKKEKKSSGSKLKQNEGTGTKPVVKKHDKDKYENQIGGASVKIKTVSKQKPKKGASFGNKNLQQEQPNQNTKGNKRPKQGLGNVAAPEKCHSEKKVVRTSNIPQKKLKKEKKSSGFKLKQNERTRMKPVVKKHDKHKYENQIGGARVKTKTVSKQKPKKDASFGNKNLQQEQTNQNTKGNKRPKQGLGDIAPPGKRRPEKKVVQTSNIPQKKLKKEKKSSGSKLKQNERTGMKPVVKKHDKNASKLAGENSKATATKPVSGATRNLCLVACSSARLEKGTWMPYFNPNISVRAIDDRTAASMAQWVVDTVENSGSKITPYKACHLDKETYAALLSEHIFKRHRTSNWMQIPGYGSDSWVQGIVNYLTSELQVKRQKDASSSASKVVE